MNNGITLSLSLKTEQSLKLSQSAQKRLRLYWDDMNSGDFAFIPTKVKGHISKEEADWRNRKLGEFAQNFLKEILGSSTEVDLLRRVKGRKLALAVGAGKGDFDSKWVKEAVVNAKLRTVWLDVSKVACNNIEPILSEQFESIPISDRSDKLRPLVILAELRSVLVDPDSILLNFDSVEIWYMCRVLEIISTRSVKIVLRQIGKYLALSECNSLVIVDAILDYNPGYTGLKNSKLYSKEFFLHYLSVGASSDGVRRKACICKEDKFLYFDKWFCALQIKIKL